VFAAEALDASSLGAAYDACLGAAARERARRAREEARRRLAEVRPRFLAAIGTADGNAGRG
jgi:hypothetical protein